MGPRCILFGVAVLVAAGAARAQATCDAPQVLIVLDRSSSMGDRAPLADGTTKWDAAVRAITDLTASYESTVYFGLLMFPGAAGECTPGTIDVPVGPLHAAAIASAMSTPPPHSGYYTPMARSLYVAADSPALADPARRSFVALVADGWEWCDPYDPATRFDPVEAVEAMAARGITAFVIGFGGSVDALTLNRMARAAGTDRPGCDPASEDPASPDNCYAQVEDRAGLASALEDIARRVTEEVCDGMDNDCDGETDEGLRRECRSACGVGEESCVGGAWAGCDAPLGEEEICDGVDNDCDGETDEGCACTEGDTMPCGVAAGACVQGAQTCEGGLWGPCEGATGPRPEVCDGVDNDCDGETDEDDDCGPGLDCIDGACVDVTEPPEGDGGPTTPPDDESDPGDANTTGCACRAGAGPAAALPALALLALVAGLAHRRRDR